MYFGGTQEIVGPPQTMKDKKGPHRIKSGGITRKNTGEKGKESRRTSKEY